MFLPLLQKSSFSRIPVELLWHLTLLVTGVLVVLSIFTLVQRQNSKRRERKRIQILQQWNDMLAELLMTENMPETGLTLPAAFWQSIRQPFVRQVVAAELVRTHASLRGQMAEMVVQIYNQLKLYDHSLRLLHQRQWHRKAMGLQQLSSMAQYRYADLIVAHTNHPHLSVRSEAQVGMIRLEGPAGLRFLSSLRKPLSEWQQFNLLHELQLHGATNPPELEPWLAAEEPTVVVFAIRLCHRYQLFRYAPSLQSLTRHAHPSVRVAATECLEHWELNPATNIQMVPTTAPLQALTA